MSDRSDLIAEAHDLEIEFKGNISNINLAALVAEAKGEPPPVEESAPAGPAIKSGETNSVDDDVEVVEHVPSARDLALAKQKRRRKIIGDAKRRALETRIVTITNKDNRENNVMTTCYLSFENQHFGLSKNVPLDIPVELERALIEIASSCTMTLHKDEIVDGKRTGNKVPHTVKKYAISYSSRNK